MTDLNDQIKKKSKSKENLKKKKIIVNDGKELENLFKNIKEYVESNTYNDEKLLSCDINNLKDQFRNNIEKIFDPIFKRKKNIIEKIKKNCKKQYKESIKLK